MLRCYGIIVLWHNPPRFKYLWYLDLEYLLYLIYLKTDTYVNFIMRYRSNSLQNNYQTQAWQRSIKLAINKPITKKPQIINCKLLSQRKWRKRRASGSAHALPRRRIAKLLRDCRIMPKKNRNARPWTAGQGVMRHGRRIKAGFVKHRTTPRHNSYSLLAA